MSNLYSIKNGKIRVWLEELPCLPIATLKVAQSSKLAKPAKLEGTRFATAEVFTYSGGLLLTGLLGATYSPDKSEMVTIHIDISEKEDKVIEWALASQVDVIMAGLTEYFVKNVIEGTFKVDPLLGGSIRYSCAGYGIEGGASIVFTKLAHLVTSLLMTPYHDLNDETILGFIKLQWSISDLL